MSVASALFSDGRGKVPVSCANARAGSSAATAAVTSKQRLFDMRVLPCPDPRARSVEDAFVIAEEDGPLRFGTDPRENRIPKVENSKICVDAGWSDIVRAEQEAVWILVEQRRSARDHVRVRDRVFGKFVPADVEIDMTVFWVGQDAFDELEVTW